MRISLIMACLVLLIVPLQAGRAGLGTNDKLSQVDHIIYATQDLAATVDDFEARLGVRAVPAGSSPGRGTHSALLALGDGKYLEIVAPDPTQQPPLRLPWYFKGLKTPRIVLWAAKGVSLDSLRTTAVARGVPLGEVMSSSRTRPDGVVLNWRFTSPRVPIADGVVPFFIDWGDTPHPSQSSPAGVRLKTFRGEHPDAHLVRRMLRQVGLRLPIRNADRPGLVAVLVGPGGQLELR